MPIRIVDTTTDDQPDPDRPEPRPAGNGRSWLFWLVFLTTVLLLGLAAGWGLNCAIIGECMQIAWGIWPILSKGDTDPSADEADRDASASEPDSTQDETVESSERPQFDPEPPAVERGASSTEPQSVAPDVVRVRMAGETDPETIVDELLGPPTPRRKPAGAVLTAEIDRQSFGPLHTVASELQHLRRDTNPFLVAIPHHYGITEALVDAFDTTLLVAANKRSYLPVLRPYLPGLFTISTGDIGSARVFHIDVAEDEPESTDVTRELRAKKGEELHPIGAVEFPDYYAFAAPPEFHEVVEPALNNLGDIIYSLEADANLIQVVGFTFEDSEAVIGGEGPASGPGFRWPCGQSTRTSSNVDFSNESSSRSTNGGRTTNGGGGSASFSGDDTATSQAPPGTLPSTDGENGDSTSSTTNTGRTPDDDGESPVTPPDDQNQSGGDREPSSTDGSEREPTSESASPSSSQIPGGSGGGDADGDSSSGAGGSGNESERSGEDATSPPDASSSGNDSRDGNSEDADPAQKPPGNESDSPESEGDSSDGVTVSLQPPGTDSSGGRPSNSTDGSPASDNADSPSGDRPQRQPTDDAKSPDRSPSEASSSGGDTSDAASSSTPAQRPGTDRSKPPTDGSPIRPGTTPDSEGTGNGSSHSGSQRPAEETPPEPDPEPDSLPGVPTQPPDDGGDDSSDAIPGNGPDTEAPPEYKPGVVAITEHVLNEIALHAAVNDEEGQSQEVYGTLYANPDGVVRHYHQVDSEEYVLRNRRSVVFKPAFKRLLRELARHHQEINHRLAGDAHSHPTSGIPRQSSQDEDFNRKVWSNERNTELIVGVTSGTGPEQWQLKSIQDENGDESVEARKGIAGKLVRIRAYSGTNEAKDIEIKHTMGG